MSEGMMLENMRGEGGGGGEGRNLNSSRPPTSSTARFGQLSFNSFFARHNPHPSRVRMLKGLNDLPICYVTDDGHELNSSGRSSRLTFPPNTFNKEKITSSSPAYTMPVSAINVNSQKVPMDTITGLQYFTKMKNFSMKEKADVKLGMVPDTDNWRSELRALTEAALLPVLFQQQQQQQTPPRRTAPSPSGRRQIYSPTTGRLMPPPSRAMSRKSQGRPATGMMMPSQIPKFDHITPTPDLESQVFTMLCQILQTEDVYSVQSWLTSANDREKGMVLDMIQAAVSNKDEYYEMNPTGEILSVPATASRAHRGGTSSAAGESFLPPIDENDSNHHVDRLTIHHDDEPTDLQQTLQTALDLDITQVPDSPAVTNGVFRPQSTTAKQPVNGKVEESPRLRMTRTPQPPEKLPETCLSAKMQKTWNPNSSTA